MNTCRGKANLRTFKYYWILDIGFSSTIIMIKLITKLKTKEYYVMQWQTEAGNITTNLKVEIYFTLPDFIKMRIMMQ